MSTSSTDWAALAAASSARGRAHLATLARKPVNPATQGARTLAAQRNMDWRADVAAFKFEVYEPTAPTRRSVHLLGTRGR